MISSRKIVLVTLGLIALHLALLILFVFTRSIDVDEGFYLSAAQQVAHGAVPYVEFFFPQMPFLASVLSFTAGHGFETLYYSRIICALVSSLTMMCFAILALQVAGERRVAVAMIGLYACSGLVVSWHSVAKTYPWTDLFLLAGFWMLLRMMSTRRLMWAIAAAICLGIDIGFRLVFVGLIPLYGYAVISAFPKKRIKAVLSFLAGLLVVLLPILVTYHSELSRFYFDNLGFHFLRDSQATVPEALLQRLLSLLKLVISPQILVLLFLAVVVFYRRIEAPLKISELVQTPGGLAWGMAATISVIYILPSPIHQQYFEQAIPFVILGLPLGLSTLWEERRRYFRQVSNRTARWSLAGVYLIGFVPFVVVYINGARYRERAYSLQNVRELSEFVASYPQEGPLYSEWAGLPALSGRASIPGLEFIGFDYRMNLDDTHKRFYRMPVNEDLKLLLESQLPALYVAFNDPDPELAEVVSRRYRLERSFDRFHVYARK